MKLYDEFKERGFVVLLVDVGETRKTVQEFFKKTKASFPVLLDKDGKISNKYRVRAYPAHFFVDRQGVLIGETLGGRDWTTDKVRELIRFLVKKIKGHKL